MLLPGVAEKYTGTFADVMQETYGRTPEYGDYLASSAADAFERTTTSAIMTELQVQIAEENEYGVQAPGYIPPPEEFVITPGGGQGKAPEYIPKEAWNDKHPLYRKGVEWRDGMTVVRASIYAEDYDKRQHRQYIATLGGESYGFIKGTIPGFFAGLLGSLPDPVNLVPFGGVIRGGRTVGAGIARGMVEGAAGNAAADAIVLPDLKSRGADVGFVDFALDTSFGAILGGALGGVGGLINRRRLLKLKEETDGNTRDEATTYLRKNINGADRQTVLNASQLASEQLADNIPINVAPVLDGSPTIRKVQVESLVRALETQEFTDVNFGRLREDYKAALNEIRTEEGVPLIEGDDLIIPANVVRKLYNERMVKNKYAADEIAEILLNVFHRDADFAATTRYPQNQAVVSLRRNLADIGFISVNEKTGETVIKGGYKTEKDSLTRKLSPNNTPEGRGIPHTVDGEGSPPLAAPRLSALQGDKKILTLDTNVNRYAQEAPEKFIPAPESLEAGPSSRAEEMGIDPATGRSLDETQADALIESGRANPEYAIEMARAKEAAAKLPEIEETGYAIMDCIIGASL